MISFFLTAPQGGGVEVRQGGMISPFYSRETENHGAIQGPVMARRIQERALAAA